MGLPLLLLGASSSAQWELVEVGRVGGLPEGEALRVKRCWG